MFINQILTKLKSLVYSKSEIDSLLNGKASSSHTHTKSQITDFPTIPTVNNATLTIQKNGTTVKSFTANASSNVTANITVPTNTNQLTNGAGFITSEIDSMGEGWVRFKCGLQICFGVAKAGQNNAFPKAFKSGTIPHINLTHYTSNNMSYSATVQFGTGGSTTSTTFNFLLWKLTEPGSYVNYECHYAAIGYWK